MWYSDYGCSNHKPDAFFKRLSRHKIKAYYVMTVIEGHLYLLGRLFSNRHTFNLESAKPLFQPTFINLFMALLNKLLRQKVVRITTHKVGMNQK